MESLGNSENLEDWGSFRLRVGGRIWECMIVLVQQLSRGEISLEEEQERILENYFYLGGVEISLNGYKDRDYQILLERMRGNS